jgi:hypothetical protein
MKYLFVILSFLLLSCSSEEYTEKEIISIKNNLPSINYTIYELSKSKIDTTYIWIVQDKNKNNYIDSSKGFYHTGEIIENAKIIRLHRIFKDSTFYYKVLDCRDSTYSIYESKFKYKKGEHIKK